MGIQRDEHAGYVQSIVLGRGDPPDAAQRLLGDSVATFLRHLQRRHAVLVRTVALDAARDESRTVAC